MKKSARAKNHMWTKEQIKSVLKMWSDHTRQEIIDKLGVSQTNLTAITYQIRKAGYPLPKKHNNGYLQNLIKEVLADLK